MSLFSWSILRYGVKFGDVELVLELVGFKLGFWCRGIEYGVSL